MKLFNLLKNNPEAAEKEIERIRNTRIRSTKYLKFYEEYNINYKKYDSRLLEQTYEQWNRDWGRCCRCNPKSCNIKDEHVEIHDGKIERVKCTREPKKQLEQLPKTLAEKTIEDYKPQNESQQKAKDKTLKLMDAPDNVIYWGQDKGIGKSMCAATLFNSIREDRLYWNFVTLINRMKSRFANNKGVDRIVDKLFNVDVLLIDDFGKGNYTEWIRDTVYDMIEQRSNKELITILTCDLKPSELRRKLGRSIVSRLKEFYHIIRMNGEDYRDIIQDNKEINND